VPSQKQLKWSQLRVGLTVLFATITLAVLIFLMSGTGGVFTRKISLQSRTSNNSGGLRIGAPVAAGRCGHWQCSKHPAGAGPRQRAGGSRHEGQYKYAFNLHKDSVTSLATAGVLGETFIDISSVTAKGPQAVDGDTLAIEMLPRFRT